MKNEEMTIMKKTYFNPEMEIISAETQQMLATSAGYDSTPVAPGNVDAPGLDIPPSFLDF